MVLKENKSGSIQDSTTNDSINKVLVELEKDTSSLNIVKNDADSLSKALSIPVGMNYEPWIKHNWGLSDWLLYALGVIITGLSAAVGAPFWFDVLKNIPNTLRLNKTSTLNK